MATRLYNIENGTALEDWNGPWLISGADGNPGEDGTSIEFIYRLNGDHTQAPGGYDGLSGTIPVNGERQSITFTNTSSIEYKNSDDYVPNNWSDNALGISNTPSTSCCWVSIRTKTKDGWTPFNAPILWSRWGQNGTDGDGVEYIFWASSDGSAPLQDPSTWSTSSTTLGKYDRIFQDNDYVGPTNSEWQDNPINLKSVQYGPGSVQYVSMRKFNGTTKLWEAFSEPAFWSNYAVDGIVEGYVVDLSNEVMPMVVDANTGNLYSNYSNNTDVSVFHNGIKEVATVVAGTPERSDGGNVIGITATVTTSSNDPDDKNVAIYIPTTVTSLNGVNVYIPLTITLNAGESNESTRNALITCFGIAGGEGAVSFDLKTDVAVIRRNIAGTSVDPSAVRVWLSVTDSSGNITDYYATNAASCPLNGTLTFDYAYDTGSYTTLSTQDITSLQANHNQLVVRAKLNGTPIDIERIPYIKDGE